MDSNYSPRRSQNHHTKRNPNHPRVFLAVLLPLIILIAAVIAFPHVLPLLQSHPDAEASASAGASAISDAVSSVPASDVSSADTSETSRIDTSDISSDAPDTSTATQSSASVPDQTSSYVVDGVDLAILVNSTHPLPDGYDIPLTELDNGQQVATVMMTDLQQMLADAKAEGIYAIVASGFRTAEKQQSLMDEKIQSFVDQGMSRSAAETEALKWVNAVGCSEHQSGLAVDINADGIHSAGYQVYPWLAENAWKYGFILRYPEEKTAITGTDYEAWHYRYVGRELAADIYQQGVCLEEYLGQ